ncbi:hypothetical protein TetV_494 [Tetraselmis virus 1]|uniref:Uncharacterized protein n=1 Tax=Tetraselmis virus 1 TaxID=2060617 RepID=A0A2P0VNU4_9VIRU|nr:hypothetical protein QJ968_gp560 [Tetraselmis virus 1]AUF82576.1 hypothetical protein TetV_494 [Tetraselmis virus 1]
MAKAETTVHIAKCLGITHLSLKSFYGYDTDKQTANKLRRAILNLLLGKDPGHLTSGTMTMPELFLCFDHLNNTYQTYDENVTSEKIASAIKLSSSYASYSTGDKESFSRIGGVPRDAKGRSIPQYSFMDETEDVPKKVYHDMIYLGTFEITSAIKGVPEWVFDYDMFTVYVEPDDDDDFRMSLSFNPVLSFYKKSEMTELKNKKTFSSSEEFLVAPSKATSTNYVTDLRVRPIDMHRNLYFEIDENTPRSQKLIKSLVDKYEDTPRDKKAIDFFNRLDCDFTVDSNTKVRIQGPVNSYQFYDELGYINETRHNGSFSNMRITFERINLTTFDDSESILCMLFDLPITEPVNGRCSGKAWWDS